MSSEERVEMQTVGVTFYMALMPELQTPIWVTRFTRYLWRKSTPAYQRFGGSMSEMQRYTVEGVPVKIAKELNKQGFVVVTTEQWDGLQAVIAEKDNTPDFARGFRAGEQSVLRTNRSGCCCKWDDKDEGRIVSLCEAHKEYIEAALAEKDKQIAKLISEGQEAASINNHNVEVSSQKITALTAERDNLRLYHDATINTESAREKEIVRLTAQINKTRMARKEAE